MHCRLQKTSNETLQAFMNIKNDKAWINKTIKLEESIGIPNIANETKGQKKENKYSNKSPVPPKPNSKWV